MLAARRSAGTLAGAVIPPGCDVLQTAPSRFAAAEQDRGLAIVGEGHGERRPVGCPAPLRGRADRGQHALDRRVVEGRQHLPVLGRRRIPAHRRRLRERRRAAGGDENQSGKTASHLSSDVGGRLASGPLPAYRQTLVARSLTSRYYCGPVRSRHRLRQGGNVGPAPSAAGIDHVIDRADTPNCLQFPRQFRLSGRQHEIECGCYPGDASLPSSCRRHLPATSTRDGPTNDIGRAASSMRAIRLTRIPAAAA